MGRHTKVYTKTRDAYHKQLAKIDAGSIRPPRDTNAKRALVEDAIARGAVEVTKCPPGKPRKTR